MEKEREWLHARGLTDKTIAEAGLVWQNGRIKIPYRINGKEVGYQVRYTEEKKFEFKQGFAPTLYLPTGHYPQGYDVWVTEGAMDALVLHQLGKPAVAIPSASTYAVVSELPFRNVALAVDNDDPGEDAAKRIAAMGLPFKLFRVKYKGKDPNECVLANGGNFPHEVVPYMPWDITHVKDVHLNGNITDRSIVQFTNGMPDWDAGNLVVLYGQEKSGKSSTMLSIIAMAQNARTPTFFESYEMQKHETKDWFQKLGGTDASQLYLFTNFNEFSQHDLYARIHFCATMIGIKLFVIDHIQSLSSGKDNEVSFLADLSKRLKLLAMKHGICIVVLSHETDGKIRGCRLVAGHADHILHLRRLSNAIMIDGVHRYHKKGTYQFSVFEGAAV